jgi:hypothetical protein
VKFVTLSMLRDFRRRATPAQYAVDTPAGSRRRNNGLRRASLAPPFLKLQIKVRRASLRRELPRRCGDPLWCCWECFSSTTILTKVIYS